MNLAQVCTQGEPWSPLINWGMCRFNKFQFFSYSICLPFLILAQHLFVQNAYKLFRHVSPCKYLHHGSIHVRRIVGEEGGRGTAMATPPPPHRKLCARTWNLGAISLPYYKPFGQQFEHTWQNHRAHKFVVQRYLRERKPKIKKLSRGPRTQGDHKGMMTMAWSERVRLNALSWTVISFLAPWCSTSFWINACRSSQLSEHSNNFLTMGHDKYRHLMPYLGQGKWTSGTGKLTVHRSCKL